MEGFKALSDKLGILEAEHFISLMKNPGASSRVSSFCKEWILCGDSYP
jgi:hypothetical protein